MMARTIIISTNVKPHLLDFLCFILLLPFMSGPNKATGG